MFSAKKTFSTVAVTLLLGAGALALTTGAASARIVCNPQGDCWHTDSVPVAPGVRFETHPDDWYFHQHWDDHRHFRDYHEGHGYYRSGVWINL